MGYEQWSEIAEGAGYVGMGRTVDALPPGVYDLNSVNGILYWVPVSDRSDEIIRFPGTPTDEVISEIETFWERENSFHLHGLPHKRGILLWGPPGSGKTSTLHLVSRDVVARGGVCVLFDNATLFLAGYRMLRAIQPDTPLVVLMEDLDEILDSSNQSKILNLLDGVEQTHRVVFLATTNYPEKLGPRIVNRPSRFDRRYKVAHPNVESRRMYLETLLREGDAIDTDQYARDTEGMSLAHAKELFVATVLLGADYDGTLQKLKTMREESVSSMYDEQDNNSLRPGLYA